VSAIDVAAEVAGAVILIGGLGAYWFVAIRGAASHERAVHKERRRATRTHYAAIEAAEDDADFAPEVIGAAVAEIVGFATEIWNADASGGSPPPIRSDGEVVRTWARAWELRLGGRLWVHGDPSVDIVRLVNRHDEAEDRAILRVRMHIRCDHPRAGQRHAHSDERWTLGHAEGCWVLLAVTADPLADSILSTTLVVDPAADTERLSEESLAELSMATPTPAGVALSDLVAPDEDPSLALSELSVVDPRFTPDLLDAALHHLVEVWETAVAGSEKPLAERANTEVCDALLRPGANANLVVRDLVLGSWAVTRLHLDRTPPAVDVELHVTAVRYVMRFESAMRAGSNTERHEIRLEWTLELGDSIEVPWRLVATNSPAADIPGWP
jgi:hypothetical protein